ncbi:hypothetical protein ACH347_24445 [Saccharopolyspora sp. 5N102]|uniref:scabin-related ADP-ribosyltransferase n=1 Tax=Saccharopolyspora sp. 5N102 TaxID=3375155 RepID=UPI0037965CEE
MPTELPAGLQEALRVVGGQAWPEGDEDGLNRIADAWKKVASDIVVLRDAMQTSAADVSRDMRGDFANAYRNYAETKVEDSLFKLKQSAQELSDLARNTAADIQAAKISICVQLGFVALAIATTFIPIIGGLISGGIVATVRFAIGQIIKGVVMNIANNGVKSVATNVAKNIAASVVKNVTVSSAKAAATNVAKNVAVNGVIGEGLAMAIEGGTQLGQIASGQRTDWNEDRLKGAAISGAFGGVGGGVAQSAADGLGKAAAQGAFGEAVKEGMKSATGQVTGATINAGMQGVGGYAGEKAADAVQGHDAANSYSFTSAMAGGFAKLGGGAHISEQKANDLAKAGEAAGKAADATAVGSVKTESLGPAANTETNSLKTESSGLANTTGGSPTTGQGEQLPAHTGSTLPGYAEQGSGNDAANSESQTETAAQQQTSQTTGQQTGNESGNAGQAATKQDQGTADHQQSATESGTTTDKSSLMSTGSDGTSHSGADGATKTEGLQTVASDLDQHAASEIMNAAHGLSDVQHQGVDTHQDADLGQGTGSEHAGQVQTGSQHVGAAQEHGAAGDPSVGSEDVGQQTGSQNQETATQHGGSQHNASNGLHQEISGEQGTATQQVEPHQEAGSQHGSPQQQTTTPGEEHLGKQDTSHTAEHEVKTPATHTESTPDRHGTPVHSTENTTAEQEAVGDTATKSALQTISDPSGADMHSESQTETASPQQITQTLGTTGEGTQNPGTNPTAAKHETATSTPDSTSKQETGSEQANATQQTMPPMMLPPHVQPTSHHTTVDQNPSTAQRGPTPSTSPTPAAQHPATSSSGVPHAASQGNSHTPATESRPTTSTTQEKKAATTAAAATGDTRSPQRPETKSSGPSEKAKGKQPMRATQSSSDNVAAGNPEPGSAETDAASHSGVSDQTTQKAHELARKKNLYYGGLNRQKIAEHQLNLDKLAALYEHGDANAAEKLVHELRGPKDNPNPLYKDWATKPHGVGGAPDWRKPEFGGRQDPRNWRIPNEGTARRIALEQAVATARELGMSLRKIGKKYGFSYQTTSNLSVAGGYRQHAAGPGEGVRSVDNNAGFDGRSRALLAEHLGRSPEEVNPAELAAWREYVSARVDHDMQQMIRDQASDFVTRAEGSGARRTGEAQAWLEDGNEKLEKAETRLTAAVNGLDGIVSDPAELYHRYRLPLDEHAEAAGGQDSSALDVEMAESGQDVRLVGSQGPGVGQLTETPVSGSEAGPSNPMDDFLQHEVEELLALDQGAVSSLEESHWSASGDLRTEGHGGDETSGGVKRPASPEGEAGSSGSHDTTAAGGPDPDQLVQIAFGYLHDGKDVGQLAQEFGFDVSVVEQVLADAGILGRPDVEMTDFDAPNSEELDPDLLFQIGFGHLGEGKTPEQLAAELGVDPGVVKQVLQPGSDGGLGPSHLEREEIPASTSAVDAIGKGKLPAKGSAERADLVARVRAEREAGAEIKDLAAKYKISVGSVDNLLKESGLEQNSKAKLPAKGSAERAELAARVRAEHEAGAEINDLATKYKISESSVDQLLKQHEALDAQRASERLVTWSQQRHYGGSVPRFEVGGFDAQWWATLGEELGRGLTDEQFAVVRDYVRAREARDVLAVNPDLFAMGGSRDALGVLERAEEAEAQLAHAQQQLDAAAGGLGGLLPSLNQDALYGHYQHERAKYYASQGRAPGGSPWPVGSQGAGNLAETPVSGSEAGPPNLATWSTSDTVHQSDHVGIDMELGGIELQELHHDTPPPASPATQHKQDLVATNLIKATDVDGTELRGDLAGAMTELGIDESVQNAFQAAFSDVQLKDDFTTLSEEGVTKSIGHGAGSVEVTVRTRLVGDESPVAGPANDEPKHEVDNASGDYGKTSDENASTVRREKGVDLTGMFGLGTSSPMGALEASGSVKASAVPGWKFGTDSALQHSSKVELLGGTRSSRHDLGHEITVTRHDGASATRHGTQESGVVVTIPESLQSGTDAAPVVDAQVPHPQQVHSAHLRGDNGLFDEITKTLPANHPLRRELDAIGSTARGQLHEMVSGAGLSLRAGDLLGGREITKALEYQHHGRTRTATVHIGASVHSPTLIHEQDATVTGTGGAKTEHAASELTKQSTDVRFGGGGLIAIPRGEDASFAAGARGDVNVQAKVGGTGSDEHIMKNTTGAALESEHTATGPLRAYRTTLDYNVRIVFDDGNSIDVGSHHVEAGATVWMSPEDAVSNGWDSATQLESSGSTPVQSDTATPLSGISPLRVFGGKVEFGGVDRVATELHQILDDDVLPPHHGAGHQPAHVSKNVDRINALITPDSFAAHAAELVGGGWSFLLPRDTHVGTSTGTEHVWVKIRATPGRYEATPVAVPGDGELQNTLTASSHDEHATKIKGNWIGTGGFGGVIPIDPNFPLRTAQFSGSYTRKIGDFERSVTVTAGHESASSWKTGTHYRNTQRIHYTIDVFGPNGRIGERSFSADATAEVPVGTNPLGGQAGEVPPASTAEFRDHRSSTPTRPGGWKQAELPDDYAVHSLNLPQGMGEKLMLEIKAYDGLGDDAAASNPLGHLGKEGVIAANRVHNFAGPTEIGANLDRAVTGTYHAQVERYRQGELVTGYSDSLGEAAMHLSLSNPKVIDHAESLGLELTTKSKGSTGRSEITKTSSDTSLDGRTNARLNQQGTMVPQGTHTTTDESGSGTAHTHEHESAKKRAYNGPGYLVSFDASIVLSGRNTEHLVGPVGDVYGKSEWTHSQVDAHDAVLLWIPADQIHQIAGLDDFEWHVDRPQGDATMHYEGGQFEEPKLGDGWVNLRPEVTHNLVSNLENALESLTHDQLPDSARVSFVGRLYHAVTHAASSAYSWLMDPSAGRLDAMVHSRLFPALSPSGLSALYSDIVGGGIRTTYHYDGPLGRTDITITVKGTEKPGRFESVSDKWTLSEESKTTSKLAEQHMTATTHTVQGQAVFSIFPEGQIQHNPGTAAAGEGSYKSETTVEDTKSIETTYKSEHTGRTVAFVHDLDLTITIEKTSGWGRLPQSLSFGVLDRFFPATASEPITVHASVKDAVRHFVPEADAHLLEQLQDAANESDWSAPKHELPKGSRGTVRADRVRAEIDALLDGALHAATEGRPAPPLPAGATGTRHLISAMTTQSALSSQLNSAMGEHGYRIGGLDEDRYFEAGALNHGPIKSLTLHAELRNPQVTGVFAEGTSFEGKQTGSETLKVTHQKTLAGGTSARAGFGGLLWNSNPSGPGPGQIGRLAGEVSIKGLAAEKVVTDTSEVGGKTFEQEHSSSGKTYLVRSDVTWSITPEYRGTNVPAHWNEPRVVREPGGSVFRTDEAGLRALGLEPPEDHASAHEQTPPEEHVDTEQELVEQGDEHTVQHQQVVAESSGAAAKPQSLSDFLAPKQEDAGSTSEHGPHQELSEKQRGKLPWNQVHGTGGHGLGDDAASGSAGHGSEPSQQSNHEQTELSTDSDLNQESQQHSDQTTEPDADAAELSVSESQHQGVNWDLIVDEDRERGFVLTEPGTPVWRALNDDPAEVLQHGLRPKDIGDIRSLEFHVTTTGRTQFVATTNDPTYRHNQRRYTYEIVSSEPGIDVLATFEKWGVRHPFPWEREVAFPGVIPAKDITKIVDNETGEVIYRAPEPSVGAEQPHPNFQNDGANQSVADESHSSLDKSDSTKLDDDKDTQFGNVVDAEAQTIVDAEVRAYVDERRRVGAVHMVDQSQLPQWVSRLSDALARGDHATAAGIRGELRDVLRGRRQQQERTLEPNVKPDARGRTSHGAPVQDQPDALGEAKPQSSNGQSAVDSGSVVESLEVPGEESDPAGWLLAELNAATLSRPATMEQAPAEPHNAANQESLFPAQAKLRGGSQEASQSPGGSGYDMTGAPAEPSGSRDSDPAIVVVTDQHGLQRPPFGGTENHLLHPDDVSGGFVQTEPGITAFRWLDEHPAVVLDYGLLPKDAVYLDSLKSHVTTTGRSQFVSTTIDPDYQHKARRYRYEIRAPKPGIDVRKTFDVRGIDWYGAEWEKEVAFLGKIPKEDIVEVIEMVRDDSGRWTKNVIWTAKDEATSIGPANHKPALGNLRVGSAEEAMTIAKQVAEMEARAYKAERRATQSVYMVDESLPPKYHESLADAILRGDGEKVDQFRKELRDALYGKRTIAAESSQGAGKRARLPGAGQEAPSWGYQPTANAPATPAAAWEAYYVALVQENIAAHDPALSGVGGSNTVPDAMQRAQDALRQARSDLAAAERGLRAWGLDPTVQTEPVLGTDHMMATTSQDEVMVEPGGAVPSDAHGLHSLLQDDLSELLDVEMDEAAALPVDAGGISPGSLFGLVSWQDPLPLPDGQMVVRFSADGSLTQLLNRDGTYEVVDSESGVALDRGVHDGALTGQLLGQVESSLPNATDVVWQQDVVPLPDGRVARYSEDGLLAELVNRDGSFELVDSDTGFVLGTGRHDEGLTGWLFTQVEAMLAEPEQVGAPPVHDVTAAAPGPVAGGLIGRVDTATWQEFKNATPQERRAVLGHPQSRAVLGRRLKLTHDSDPWMTPYRLSKETGFKEASARNLIEEAGVGVEAPQLEGRVGTASWGEFAAAGPEERQRVLDHPDDRAVLGRRFKQVQDDDPAVTPYRLARLTHFDEETVEALTQEALNAVPAQSLEGRVGTASWDEFKAVFGAFPEERLRILTSEDERATLARRLMDAIDHDPSMTSLRLSKLSGIARRQVDRMVAEARYASTQSTSTDTNVPHAQPPRRDVGASDEHGDSASDGGSGDHTDAMSDVVQQVSVEEMDSVRHRQDTGADVVEVVDPDEHPHQTGTSGQDESAVGSDVGDQVGGGNAVVPGSLGDWVGRASWADLTEELRGSGAKRRAVLRDRVARGVLAGRLKGAYESEHTMTARGLTRQTGIKDDTVLKLLREAGTQIRPPALRGRLVPGGGGFRLDAASPGQAVDSARNGGAGSSAGQSNPSTIAGGNDLPAQASRVEIGGFDAQWRETLHEVFGREVMAEEYRAWQEYAGTRAERDWYEAKLDRSAEGGSRSASEVLRRAEETEDQLADVQARLDNAEARFREFGADPNALYDRYQQDRAEYYAKQGRAPGGSSTWVGHSAKHWVSQAWAGSTLISSGPAQHVDVPPSEDGSHVKAGSGAGAPFGGGVHAAALDSLVDLGLDAQRLAEVRAEFEELASTGRLEDHSPAIAGNPGVREALQVIHANLDRIPEPSRGRLRAWVADAVLATSLVPVRESASGSLAGLDHAAVQRRSAVRVLTPNRTESVLVEIAKSLKSWIDPFDAAWSALEHSGYRPDDGLPQRLIQLSLVNLTPQARLQLRGDALFQRLLSREDALVESMFASGGHDEQRFLATCLASVANTEVLGKVPTTAGLLLVGRNLVDQVRALIDNPPAKWAGVLDERDQIFGRTIHELVSDRLAEATEAFDDIERRASELIDSGNRNPDAWAELSQRWGRTMQKLSVVVDPSQGPDSIPVLTNKLIGGHWGWSAGVSALLMVLDRPFRRFASVDNIGFSKALQTTLVDEGLQRREVEFTRWSDEFGAAECWRRVHRNGGATLTTATHAVWLEAVQRDGQQAFLVHDPKKSHPDHYSLAGMLEWARRNKFTMDLVDPPDRPFRDEVPQKEAQRSPESSVSTSDNWSIGAESVESVTSSWESSQHATESSELSEVSGDWPEPQVPVVEELAAFGLDEQRFAQARAELSEWAGSGRVEDYTAEILSWPELGRALREIRANLDLVPGLDVARLKSLVADAALSAALVPVRDVVVSGSMHHNTNTRHERLAAQPLSPHGLLELLDNIADLTGRGKDPFQARESLLRHSGYEPEQGPSRRLTQLSLVNLNPHLRQQLVHDGLFQRLLENEEALGNALFGTDGHDWRDLLAAHGLQAGTMPTIGGLLQVGRAVVRHLDDQLTALTMEVSHTRAGQPRGGDAVDEFVRQHLTRTQEAFDEIEQMAQDSFDSIEQTASAFIRSEADGTHIHHEQWAELTRAWSSTMRAMLMWDGPALDGLHAALSDAASTNGIREQVRVTGETEPGQLWERVRHNGGTVRATIGEHTQPVLVQAVRQDGTPLFAVADPEVDHVQMLDLNGFVRWADNAEAVLTLPVDHPQAANISESSDGEASLGGETSDASGYWADDSAESTSEPDSNGSLATADDSVPMHSSAGDGTEAPSVKTGDEDQHPRSMSDRNAAPPSWTTTEYRTFGSASDTDGAAQKLARGPFAHRANEQMIDGGDQSFPRYLAVRPVLVDEHPPVRISGDGTVAIAAHGHGAKEVFATLDVVRRAQADLDRVGGAVRLHVDETSGIEFEVGGKMQRLYRVVPDFGERGASDISKEFTRDVFGASPTHAVLYDTRPPNAGGTGKLATAPINTTSDKEISGTHQLADALVSTTPELANTEWAAGQVRRGWDEQEHDSPTPGKGYGRAFSRTGSGSSEVAAKLGINEHARPQVGEGYLIQPISHGTNNDGGRRFSLDFSSGTEEGRRVERMRFYRFAPVVLESADGQHHIVLENTRRREADNRFLRTVLEENLAHYATRVHELEQVLVEAKADGGTGSRALFADSLLKVIKHQQELAELGDQDPGQAKGELAAAKGNAVRALAALSGEEFGTSGDQWWFEMFGRAPGESLFESDSHLGDKPNALVLTVIPDHDDKRVQVEFGAGATQLDELAAAQTQRFISKLAGNAAWLAKQGAPLPQVHITVESLPDELGAREQRSAAVVQALRKHAAALGLDVGTMPVVIDHRVRDVAALRAQRSEFGFDEDEPIRTVARVHAQLSGPGAEKPDPTPPELTSRELAELARTTGLHRAPTPLGKHLGKHTEVTTEEIGRMREIVRTARQLDPVRGDDPAWLTSVRRISDLQQRSGVADLDALVRQVFGLAGDAEVHPRDRRRLVDLVPHAKRSGRQVTLSDLIKAWPTPMPPPEPVPNEIAFAGPREARYDAQAEPTPKPSMVTFSSAAAGQASATQPVADSSIATQQESAPNADSEEPSTSDASEPEWVVGRNADTEEEVRFDPGEVQSWELKDSNGELIGITFVSDADEREGIQTWTEIGGTADKVNYSSPLSADDVQGMSEEEWEASAKKPVLLPWDSPLGSGQNPIPINAHADETAFEVTRTDGTTVAVGGEAFAKIVAKPAIFKALCEQQSGSASYQLLACESGKLNKPGGSAFDFQQALSKLGHGGTVFAPTEVVSTGSKPGPSSPFTVVFSNGGWAEFDGQEVPGGTGPQVEEPTGVVDPTNSGGREAADEDTTWTSEPGEQDDTWDWDFETGEGLDSSPQPTSEALFNIHSARPPALALDLLAEVAAAEARGGFWQDAQLQPDGRLVRQSLDGTLEEVVDRYGRYQTVHAATGQVQSSGQHSRKLTDQLFADAHGLSTMDGVPFVPGQVRMTPLVADDGEIIGVTFMGEEEEIADDLDWASAESGHDVGFIMDNDSTDSTQPSLIQHEAPWVRDGHPWMSFPIAVHSDSIAFEIYLMSEGRSDRASDIDGQTFALLVTSLLPFRAVASTVTSFQLMACEAGELNEPGGSAYDFQQALARMFFHQSVYAATGVVTLYDEQVDGSAVHERGAVTRVSPGGEWRRFPGGETVVRGDSGNE